MNDSTLHTVAKSTLHPLLLLLLALVSGCGGESGNGSETPRILIDSVHAHNYHNEGLRPFVYEYHSSHGYRLAFDFLKSAGVELDEMTEGTLTLERLSQYDMLFMNLPTGNLPPFTVSEINAVKTYVNNGGSVFFITDHSNCYYHAWKLKPLFNELGMEVTTETACEPATQRLSDGKRWISIASFKEHPITRGLRRVAYQSGGTIDDRYAVAHTSSEAWGDEWIVKPYGEGTSLAFWGNNKADPDERKGPLGVIAARTLGKGRIVVVADQNTFGDEFIKYADNYRLFLNSANWLLRGNDERAANWANQFLDGQFVSNLSDPNPQINTQASETRPTRFIGHEHPDRPAFGNDNATLFLNLFVYLQRKHWMFATEDLSIPAELIILPDDHELSDANLDAVLAHLRAGKPVLVLGTGAFAFTINEGFTGQLVNKIGRPTQRDTSSLAEVAQFEDTGRVVVALITESLHNHSLSKPDEEPTEDHRLTFKRIDALIDLSFKKENPKTD